MYESMKRKQALALFSRQVTQLGDDMRHYIMTGQVKASSPRTLVPPVDGAQRIRNIFETEQVAVRERTTGPTKEVTMYAHISESSSIKPISFRVHVGSPISPIREFDIVTSATLDGAYLWNLEDNEGTLLSFVSEGCGPADVASSLVQTVNDYVLPRRFRLLNNHIPVPTGDSDTERTEHTTVETTLVALAVYGEENESTDEVPSGLKFRIAGMNNDMQRVLVVKGARTGREIEVWRMMHYDVPESDNHIWVVLDKAGVLFSFTTVNEDVANVLTHAIAAFNDITKIGMAEELPGLVVGSEPEKITTAAPIDTPEGGSDDVADFLYGIQTINPNWRRTVEKRIKGMGAEAIKELADSIRATERPDLNVSIRDKVADFMMVKRKSVIAAEHDEIDRKSEEVILFVKKTVDGLLKRNDDWGPQFKRELSQKDWGVRELTMLITSIQALNPREGEERRFMEGIADALVGTSAEGYEDLVGTLSDVCGLTTPSGTMATKAAATCLLLALRSEVVDLPGPTTVLDAPLDALNVNEATRVLSVLRHHLRDMQKTMGESYGRVREVLNKQVLHALSRKKGADTEVRPVPITGDFISRVNKLQSVIGTGPANFEARGVLYVLCQANRETQKLLVDAMGYQRTSDDVAELVRELITALVPSQHFSDARKAILQEYLGDLLAGAKAREKETEWREEASRVVNYLLETGEDVPGETKALLAGVEGNEVIVRACAILGMLYKAPTITTGGKEVLLTRKRIATEIHNQLVNVIQAAQVEVLPGQEEDMVKMLRELSLREDYSHRLLVRWAVEGRPKQEALDYLTRLLHIKYTTPAFREDVSHNITEAILDIYTRVQVSGTTW